jgi:phosphatidate phosphatase PAH1
VFVTNSSSLQKRVKIIMREDDENKDDANDAKLKPKKKNNKMLLHRVGSGLIDVATTTSGLTASAVSTLVPNPGGAIDVLVVENRSTKSLRCTPFFVRFGNAKSFFSKKLLSADATYVSFHVNGRKFEQFRMKLSRNGTCQFAHENCAQDALYFDGWDETTKTVETTASTSMVKTRMDGENANANGNYGSLLNETESIAIEEAEEAGRSSEDDEEEDGEEEEAPKAPLTSSEATTTKTTTTTTANAASSGKYTRAKKWLKTKVGGLSGNHSSGGSKHSNSADKNNNNNNNNNGKEKKEAKAAKPPRKRRNTRLTSEELKMLDLKPGLNTVTYSYKSRVFGTQTLECNLFLWDSGDKVVVSDIDGTITKSDVLGHIYTMVGKDYAHPGIASLYRKIVRNGYKILFVTSRAISQSNSTRAYLRTLTQNGETLPIGPVMCAPDPISTALYREVVARKPEVFKIRCLTRVRRLFDVDINKTRMFAGFGNRSSDALAYKTCGIELDKIYTIDPKSRLRSEKTGETFEIQHLMDKVDQAFPRIEGRIQNDNEEEEEVEVAARWRITAEDKERKKGEESRVKCLFMVEEKSQAVHCSLFIE